MTQQEPQATVNDDTLALPVEDINAYYEAFVSKDRDIGSPVTGPDIVAPTDGQVVSTNTENILESPESGDRYYADHVHRPQRLAQISNEMEKLMAEKDMLEGVQP